MNDRPESRPRSKYIFAAVLFLVLVAAIAVPLHLFQFDLIGKLIFYGDAGLPVPAHEAIAARVLLAPMDLLNNRFFLEAARSYFSDDSEILLLWSRIIAILWALPISGLVTWISMGQRRKKYSK